MDRKILMIIGEERVLQGGKSLNSLEGMNSSSQWKDGLVIRA